MSSFRILANSQGNYEGIMVIYQGIKELEAVIFQGYKENDAIATLRDGIVQSSVGVF